MGTGPQAEELRQQVTGHDDVRFVGEASPRDVKRFIAESACVVSPSVCYETFGMAVIEAFAQGRPVIVSDGGTSAELVDDQRTGLLFENGSAGDLAHKLSWLLSNLDIASRMGAAARCEYMDKYTPQANLNALEGIYHRVVSETSAGRAANEVAEVPHTGIAPPFAADESSRLASMHSVSV